MSLDRPFDGWRPVRPEEAGLQEERRSGRSWRIATGTLACPRCDAPVAPPGAVAPADALGCPYCGHGGAVREFLSLAAPSRPAHVEVRVVDPGL